MSGVAADSTTLASRARRKPLLVALGATALVTVLAYWLPTEYAATGVGLGFLTVTYWVALHRNDDGSRHYGLSLGGVLDPEPIDPRRLVRSTLSSLAWALGLVSLVFPFFWAGFVWWWKPAQPFVLPPRAALADEILGQLLVIALPEEAFFRGYLQTALDDAWPPRFNVLGAKLGLGILVTSVIFAVGHVLTEFHANRLAVFFPALVFGWLRARTRSIGPSLIFHAACNVFASLLGQSYGLVH